jgi:hypothetical protein
MRRMSPAINASLFVLPPSMVLPAEEPLVCDRDPRAEGTSIPQDNHSRPLPATARTAKVADIPFLVSLSAGMAGNIPLPTSPTLSEVPSEEATPEQRKWEWIDGPAPFVSGRKEIRLPQK